MLWLTQQSIQDKKIDKYLKWWLVGSEHMNKGFMRLRFIKITVESG